MKILVVEDNQQKLNAIIDVINSTKPDIEITTCNVFVKFIECVNKEKYDLLVTDLLLPIFKDRTEEDVTMNIIDAARGPDSLNLQTPVIAITQFTESAESNYQILNRNDINVITYSPYSEDWKEPFIKKIFTCTPKKRYDFVIICALQKEADAYFAAGYTTKQITIQHGLSCNEITIGNSTGLIIVPPRMGLVNASIVSARAIDLFEPRVICMSGICAGIEGRANIYDIVIPSQCDQHDSGKWTNEGFVSESYSVPLEHEIQLKIDKLIRDNDLIDEIKLGVILNKPEMIGESGNLDINIYLAPTSSGSSVIADDSMLKKITTQHRKKNAFEMESYALYEAARQSPFKPSYFSAKAIVDNGDSQKGDNYHRVAALISAKAVFGILKRLLQE
ncbi:nucleoside phosphorylase [Vibrio cholerae]|nr:nucleoside phosphorylase [Vibrio cholerae]EKF9991548.1 nucleoside phosphorylase [Vibrio cholerae]